MNFRVIFFLECAILEVIEKICENVYFIGVLNPSLRIFDVVMQANYGTSYNSYLITGEKNIIVDTVHVDFFDEYLYNIQSLVDLNDIDYIIINHAEPDHSGSLKKILDIAPKAKVVCTFAAHKYLKQIMNMDFDAICVKDEDSLNFKCTNLKFIVAPMLHWPDSMMTFFENEKILFSCDFMGAHFCESSLLDTQLHYKDKYLLEFKNYYDCIFSPFKSFVLKGIEKIKNLDIEVICPSHGPFLTETAKERLFDYSKWSSGEDKKEREVVILFASAYGFTKKLAEEAFYSIKNSSQIKIKLLDVLSTESEKIVESINRAHAVLVGSCTINRDAPKVIWDVLSSVSAINSRGKPAGVFGSYGWSGEAPNMIYSRLQDLGFKLNKDIIKTNFLPSENDLKRMREYTQEIVGEIK